MKNKNTFILIFFLLISVLMFSQETNVFISEDFSSLRNWNFLHFPVIKRHTKYSILKENDESFLVTKSDNSSSALEYKQKFNVYDYSTVEWRWKIDNVYQKGDATKKSGDDYPIRIYIIFQYDYDKLSTFDKIKYDAIKGIAMKLYGQYPPHSTLNYIWSNKYFDEDFLKSSYFPKTSRMILLQKGSENIGKWKTEKVNIIDDYRKYYGKLPPSTAILAISNDSDNTHEKAVSYLDYIKVYKN